MYCRYAALEFSKNVHELAPDFNRKMGFVEGLHREKRIRLNKKMNFNKKFTVLCYL
jgi:hypothetical protein